MKKDVNIISVKKKLVLAQQVGRLASLFVVLLMVLPSGAKVKRRQVATSEKVETQEVSDVGRAAASKKYFGENGKAGNDGPTDRLLWIHFAPFTKSKSYEWGSHSPQDKSGVQSTGVTYKMGEWTNSMDLNLRVDYEQYHIDNEYPNKLSILPLITFPDSHTNFPLYFGAGIGAGFFLNQVGKKSPLSLDYQLVVGARLLNVLKNTGFFIEGGIKDHFHLLSEGQFMGQYLGAGLVFSL